jgi:hypothetical protein
MFQVEIGMLTNENFFEMHEGQISNVNVNPAWEVVKSINF